jgi:hypothetical protein
MSYFGWIKTVLAIRDEEIFTHVGLDILALVSVLNKNYKKKLINTVTWC